MEFMHILISDIKCHWYPEMFYHQIYYLLLLLYYYLLSNKTYVISMMDLNAIRLKNPLNIYTNYTCGMIDFIFCH